MNSQVGPDPVRSRLRSAVATIEQELALLPGDESSGTNRLRQSWAELVSQLALGPVPALRECPYCGRCVMGAATLCGYCWKRLQPIMIAQAPHSASV